jgi:hypothetical protein
VSRPVAPDRSAPDTAPPDAATGIAIGFAIAGWVLYALLAPFAVFLTWWGDCELDPCSLPGRLDQLAYAFDVVWWLLFPFLAFLAYRGRRGAWTAMLASALVLDLQLLAGLLGATGFAAFGLTLPAVALVTFGAGLGLAMLVPRVRDRPGAATAGELAGIGCLGLVVAAIALQGLLVGVGGPFVGIAIVMAIALFVIGIAAFANRNRRPGSGRRLRR